jgi:two-component system response regulator AtoC
MVVGEQQAHRHAETGGKNHAAAMDSPGASGKDGMEFSGGPLTRRSILVIEDDPSTRRYLVALLSGLEYDVLASESGEEGLARLDGGARPALVLLDLILPGMAGLAVLDRIRAVHPELPVIVLSTVAQLRTVVDAVRRGASDYLTKPFQEQELDLAIQNALEKHDLYGAARPARALPGERAGAPPVSAHPKMLRLREVALQVADTDAPVLITGESGVGKEVLARFIHAQSSRRARPLVKVNCAALPQDLLESELFGYERGAFSGAVGEKPGKFELADQSSILLDEIGEMSANLQAKLLHVLQDGEYMRLGGRRPMRVDARVLATTNARLSEAVAAGRFREDLYFRLNVIRIEIPPLRDRLEDVPLLCEHFLRRYASRYGSSTRELPAELLAAFARHSWPGNVRELENAVRRFLILGLTTWPEPEEGRARAESPAAAPPETPRPAPAPGEMSLRKVAADAAEQAERELVRRTLADTRWNRREAARRLKISYKALLNKLKKWDVTPVEAPSGPDRPGKPAAH